jgi:hypothetical protein
MRIGDQKPITGDTRILLSSYLEVARAVDPWEFLAFEDVDKIHNNVIARTKVGELYISTIDYLNDPNYYKVGWIDRAMGLDCKDNFETLTFEWGGDLEHLDRITSATPGAALKTHKDLVARLVAGDEFTSGLTVEKHWERQP